jgi:ribose transport system substrate-binding protein
MKILAHRIFFFSLFITIALLIAACNSPSGSGPSNSSSTSGEAKPAAGKKLRLAFVTNNASDFWKIARKGTEKAAVEFPNVEVDFRIPDDGTAATQQRAVDDLLARGLEGMAISPVDPKNQVQMLNRAAEKALVVTQDSDAPESNRTCYIGTDNVAAGKQAGKLVKEALPNGGEIMVFVGKKDAQNAAERFRGLQEELAGSNIKILDLRTDDTDRARAKSNVSDTMVKHPNVAGLVGLWSYNGPAILNAVKEAGKISRIKIIAFDEEDETVAGIKDGSIHGTIVQQPFEFGYQSIKLMAQVLGGDKSGIPATKQNFVPTQAIKKDNVEDFAAKMKQMLGKS